MVQPESGKSRPSVTLDLWQTLIAELDGRQYSELRFVKRAENVISVIHSHGLSVDEEKLTSATRELSQMITADHDLGMDMQFIDRVSQLLTMVDDSLPVDLGAQGVNEVAVAIDKAFIERPPSFLPGAIETLESLRDLGVGVALISNTGLTSPETYRLWFEREGVLDFFDHLAFSNEVACAKPSPEIFKPALEDLGTHAVNGLHIGDNLLTDISGASSIGMSTGWISGYDEREPMVEPDYTLSSIADLESVTEKWLERHRTFGT